MRKTNKIIIFSMIIAILVVGIAYAAIQNITLNISGQAQAMADQGNFLVKFTGTPQVSDTTKVAAAITNDTNATMNVSGLSVVGEKVTATYTIQNASTDLSADLTIKTTISNKEYFKIKSELAKNTLVAGEATTVTVTLELAKTPIEDSVNATIGIQITAIPVQPGEEGTAIAEMYPKMMERTMKITGCLWGVPIIGSERVADFEYLGESISSITILDNNNVPDDALISWDVSEVNGDGKVMAWLKQNQESENAYDLYLGGNGGITVPDNSFALFANYNSCQKIEGLENLKTDNATDMSYMFHYCRYVTSLDLSSFNTQNVTDMKWMFDRCSSLTSLDLSNFNTQNVTGIGMVGMFYRCSALTSLDISNFNTQNVTNMNSMFEDCSNLTSLDLSSFDTRNINDMTKMFASAIKLKTIYINPDIWQTAATATNMFSGCGTSTLTPKP